MIPVHSRSGQEMEIHFERLDWYGRKQVIPVYIEDNIINFCLNKEVMSTETNVVNNAQQLGNEYGRAVLVASPTKTLKIDLAPTGDDIEHIEAPREDVETMKMKSHWKRRFPEKE